MAYEDVANLEEIAVGDTLLVQLSVPVCLVRLDEQDVRAIHDTCTHQQQPLHEGTVDVDDTLVCAAHAARFDLSTGRSIGVPEVAPIPVYACRVDGEAVMVDVEQQLNA